MSFVERDIHGTIDTLYLRLRKYRVSMMERSTIGGLSECSVRVFTHLFPKRELELLLQQVSMI